MSVLQVLLPRIARVKIEQAFLQRIVADIPHCIIGVNRCYQLLDIRWNLFSLGHVRWLEIHPLPNT
jgi:hypothetical protein